VVTFWSPDQGGDEGGEIPGQKGRAAGAAR
jgi:hypothetical protein